MDNLPADWENQVARAYTVFGVDPMGGADEFGGLMSRLRGRGGGGRGAEVARKILDVAFERLHPRHTKGPMGGEFKEKPGARIERTGRAVARMVPESVPSIKPTMDRPFRGSGPKKGILDAPSVEVLNREELDDGNTLATFRLRDTVTSAIFSPDKDEAVAHLWNAGPNGSGGDNAPNDLRLKVDENDPRGREHAMKLLDEVADRSDEAIGGGSAGPGFDIRQGRDYDYDTKSADLINEWLGRRVAEGKPLPPSLGGGKSVPELVKPNMDGPIIEGKPKKGILDAPSVEVLSRKELDDGNTLATYRVRDTVSSSIFSPDKDEAVASLWNAGPNGSGGDSPPNEIHLNVDKDDPRSKEYAMKMLDEVADKSDGALGKGGFDIRQGSDYRYPPETAALINEWAARRTADGKPLPPSLGGGESVPELVKPNMDRPYKEGKPRKGILDAPSVKVFDREELPDGNTLATYRVRDTLTSSVFSPDKDEAVANLWNAGPNGSGGDNAPYDLRLDVDENDPRSKEYAMKMLDKIADKSDEALGGAGEPGFDIRQGADYGYTPEVAALINEWLARRAKEGKPLPPGFRR